MSQARAALLWLLLLLPLAAAAERGPALPDYPVERVADGVYVIHGPLELPNPRNQGFMNNPGFVVTSRGVVVIDPGSSVQTGEMVLRAIRRHSDRPVIAVFNTHIHGDHWLGNQAIREAYPEAVIHGHPNMLALIEAGEGQAWVERIERMSDGKSRGTRVVAPGHAVDAGDTLRYGDHSFRIHHYGKAHTTSDIMVEVVEASTLFLGDNVLNRRIPRLDDADVQGNIEACTRILATGARVHVPGHGPTGGPEVTRHFRTYLQTLYDTVKRFYDEGLSDFEMKPQVAAALQDYADWPGFDEQLGKHISITWLQVEAAEF